MSYFEDFIEPNIGEIPNNLIEKDEDYYKYWTTDKQGTVLIDTMTTPHLMNCIKLMIRRNQQDHPTYDYIISVLRDRGINVK